MKRVLFATAALCLLPLSLLAQSEDNPLNPSGRSGETVPRGTVGVEYEYENFNDFDDWHSASVELGRKFDRGSITGKVNLARRFAKDGAQFEVEAYPKLWNKAYAYVGGAFSSSDIFPDRRYGLQVYQGLPGGFEISAGARLLDFDGAKTKLYTGSFGRYWGNYYATLQPYFADSDSRDEMSQSLQGMIRRYYSSGDDYLGFRAGYGEVPEVDILLQENIDLSNWSVRVERQRPVGAVLLRGFVGYRNQELTFQRERKSFVGGIAVRKRF
jgi:YaiO family outer membrane protein